MQLMCLATAPRQPPLLVHCALRGSCPPPAPQLLYDGQDAEAVRLLTLVRHVTLIHIHPPFASESEQVRLV